jgi:hypothetical protein
VFEGQCTTCGRGATARLHVRRFHDCHRRCPNKCEVVTQKRTVVDGVELIDTSKVLWKEERIQDKLVLVYLVPIRAI